MIFSGQAHQDRMKFARSSTCRRAAGQGASGDPGTTARRRGIDPTESATAVFNIRSQLDSELSKARAELRQLGSRSCSRMPHQVQVQSRRSRRSKSKFGMKPRWWMVSRKGLVHRLHV